MFTGIPAEALMGSKAPATTLILALLLFPSGAAGLDGVRPEVRAVGPDSPDLVLEARVWLDRGADPVLHRGDEVRIYFRSSHDAYAAIFHVDTNGLIRLLFPSTPGDTEGIRGGRDYRLLLPADSKWRVAEDPGVGYFFMLTSTEPFDFSRLRYSPLTGGWDLSPVTSRVYSDPYEAMDQFTELLLPEWQHLPFALDFATYHVGQAYSYPRFLCYDCHTAQPFRSWNPYHYTCTNFRVVIYNDPYYYPATRYRGTRVVYARPPVGGAPQFAFKERADGEGGTPLVRTRTAVGATLPPELIRGTPTIGTPVESARSTDPGRFGESLPSVIRGRALPTPTSVLNRGSSADTDSAGAGGDTVGRPVLERRAIPPTSSPPIPPTSGPPTPPTPPVSTVPPVRRPPGGG
jgi:hypothetical protein